MACTMILGVLPRKLRRWVRLISRFGARRPSLLIRPAGRLCAASGWDVPVDADASCFVVVPAVNVGATCGWTSP